MISVLAVGLCLVVLSSIGAVKSYVTIPRSSVVLIGERVELKCSVTGNDVASWKYTSWNSSAETLIYFGGPTGIPPEFRSRYKIDKNISGQRNLIIDSVDSAHAGRYRCNGVKQSLFTEVQLIVLGAQPVCSGNTSDIDVATKDQRRLRLSINCSVSYTGNAFPVLHWTKSDAENIAVNATTSGTVQGLFTNTSSITHELQANDSGVTFYCLITFQTPNTSPENAINGFAYTWNYTLYGPRNLSIVEYEDHLECSADGNPVPIYNWIYVVANVSINGSAYKLNLTNDKGRTLNCTAENIFFSVSKNHTIKGAVIKLPSHLSKADEQ